MSRASRFLAALDASLPPERLQHGRVERARETVADAAGGIGRPYLAEGLLGMLERRGAIGPRERMAGEEFTKLFTLACMDPMRASNPSQRLGRTTYNAHPSEWARGRVNLALDALGGLHAPAGSLAWGVLGEQLSLRQWAARQGWSGRPVSPHVATGILVATTGILRAHFKF